MEQHGSPKPVWSGQPSTKQTPGWMAGGKYVKLRVLQGFPYQVVEWHCTTLLAFITLKGMFEAFDLSPKYHSTSTFRGNPCTGVPSAAIKQMHTNTTCVYEAAVDYSQYHCQENIMYS